MTCHCKKNTTPNDLQKWLKRYRMAASPMTDVAITWPKIMLQKWWLIKNRHQDPAHNMNKRHGRAQWFDLLQVSLQTGHVFCILIIIIILDIDYAKMDVILNNQQNFVCLLSALSMEWSNSQEKEPTKNWINHGHLTGGTLQLTIATVSTACKISSSPYSNIYSFE